MALENAEARDAQITPEVFLLLLMMSRLMAVSREMNGCLKLKDLWPQIHEIHPNVKEMEAHPFANFEQKPMLQLAGMVCVRSGFWEKACPVIFKRLCHIVLYTQQQ